MNGLWLKLQVTAPLLVCLGFVALALTGDGGFESTRLLIGGGSALVLFFICNIGCLPMLGKVREPLLCLVSIVLIQVIYLGLHARLGQTQALTAASVYALICLVPPRPLQVITTLGGLTFLTASVLILHGSAAGLWGEPLRVVAVVSPLIGTMLLLSAMCLIRKLHQQWQHTVSATATASPAEEAP